MTNPLNRQELLLGSEDTNCFPGGLTAFHLSRDGGSTWKRVLCMPIIPAKNFVYEPGDDPSVGYDREGNAYVAGGYFGNGAGDSGLVAVQKSSDGTHWGKPRVALKSPGQSFPYETSMAVDTSPSSPWVNQVYVSGVMWSHQGGQNQVLVSHSGDGGATWTQTPVTAVQRFPKQEFFTRMAVGQDGTVFVTWMRCRYGNPQICRQNHGHMLFSKSTDGGNTWSTPREMATITMNWALPNAPGDRVYNYPVIAVDNSNGQHSGNLYVTMYTWTGTYLRVQVIRSTDGGQIWSKPVPVAPPSDTHDQFFPAISVSAKGKVGVSWLDRRNDPANINYQAFAAISTDGGRTFPNTQLTTAFSNPETGTEGGGMGDYTGNTWAGNKFIAAWMDSSNGVAMQAVIGGIRWK